MHLVKHSGCYQGEWEEHTRAGATSHRLYTRCVLNYCVNLQERECRSGILGMSTMGIGMEVRWESSQ